MNLRVAMLYLTLCGFGSIVNAQAVYRCGPEGRSYSQTPCADGRALDAADPRTADQRRQSQAAIATDQRLATALERERLAQERKPGPPAVSLGGAPRQATAEQPPAPQRKDFKASGQASSKKRSAAGTSPKAGPSSRRAPD